MPFENLTPDRFNLFQRIWYSIFPGTVLNGNADRQRYRRRFQQPAVA